jgi:hypothetical protein
MTKHLNPWIKKVLKIVANVVPIAIMISLIPFVQNDFVLMAIYVGIMVIAFMIRYEDNDHLFFIFGFFIMFICEYVFISTGVEIFIRKSLFEVMPFWLPFLWAYSFVAIKRTVFILKGPPEHRLF